MIGGRFVIRGEVYVAFETVAGWYRVEAGLLEAISELGLLESVERVEDTLAVASAELDRLAEILRLHRHLGLDLEEIEVFLGVP